MNARSPHAIAPVACLLLMAPPAGAVDQTVGLFVNEPASFEGYTLFCQLGDQVTYLLDHQGLVVNSWASEFVPGNSYYLRESGNLIRPSDPRGNGTFFGGGDAGLVEEFTWDGDLVWSFLYSNSEVRAHHDIALLPNGNVLILAWELRTSEQAIAAGRDPSTIGTSLWPEHVVEVQPTGPATGTIVWEWHMWDHLIQDFDPDQDNHGIVGEHPELIDVNFRANNSPDWIHANAIDYNAELDQILINSPRFHEFWVIDHSTTPEEAAGHAGGNSGKGGDVLYRWGNPRTYRAGTEADQRFFGQHDVHWIDPGLPGAGNILAFNNGNGRPEGPFTTIEEIEPPVDGDGNYAHEPGTAFGPRAPAWMYTADPPTSFYSSFISGAQRLPNGNTLICAGAWGTMFEVTAEHALTWRYVSPVLSNGFVVQGNDVPANGQTSDANLMFRSVRYAPDFPGFRGRDLTPSGRLEICPCPADTNFDDVVDVLDLVEVLLAWGDCTGVCRGDVTADGVVDVDDLVATILAWGDC